MISLLAIFALAATADASRQAPSWSRDVAPILYASCVECHRPDQAAPFPLLRYEDDAAKRARTIARVTTRGSMPPWHPVEGHGDFRDARGLAAAQRDLLARWAESGAPRGDPALAPAPPEFAVAWATLPDGAERRLFYIDDWDFNWQGRYEYAAPVALPAGSVVHVELRYDNSAENPRNPAHPPRRVTWGLESTDEMGAISFVATAREARDTDALRASIREHGREARRHHVQVRVDGYTRVMRLDRDGDGRLSAEEIPAAYREDLARLDRNDDGELDADELAVLRRREERDGER